VAPGLAAEDSAEAGSAAAGAGDALRVSASSRPAAVAGAIAGVVRDRRRAELIAIGAGALNQAIKAIALARGYLEPTGIDLVCVPSFVDVQVTAGERTAIRLVIEPR
jgi:stage V sporulation protein S